MNINDLMNKPLWQMTGEEFLAIINEKKPNESAAATPDSDRNTAKHYVYGLAGNSQTVRMQYSDCQPHQEERSNRQGYHPVWPQDYR